MCTVHIYIYLFIYGRVVQFGVRPNVRVRQLSRTLSNPCSQKFELNNPDKWFWPTLACMNMSVFKMLSFFTAGPCGGATRLASPGMPAHRCKGMWGVLV